MAVTLLVLPTLLWLFVVWDTRPLSAEDVAADRARVEATVEYAEDLEWCEWSFPTTDCERASLILNGAAPARKALDLSPAPWDVATLAVLAMAATSLLIGALWAPGPGVRGLLRRAATVAFATWLVAAEVGVLWWLGLGLSARMRGTDPFVGEETWSFVRYGALLVALAAVAGTSAGVLLRGRLRVVLTLAGAAVAAGVVLLLPRAPIDPWLPPLNVEAFLFGGAVYGGPPEAERCTLPDEDFPLLVFPGPGTSAPGPGYCTRDVTRTTGAAATYLVGWSGVLLLTATTATAMTSRRRRHG